MNQFNEEEAKSLKKCILISFGISGGLVFLGLCISSIITLFSFNTIASKIILSINIITLIALFTGKILLFLNLRKSGILSSSDKKEDSSTTNNENNPEE